jgi:mannosylglycoprotein endo-beta-mannosidase
VGYPGLPDPGTAVDTPIKYTHNSTAPCNLMVIAEEMWDDHEKLSVEDNENLCKCFSVEEIKNALFLMNLNRVPSLDNILIELYQQCWEIVKYDIVSLFVAFHVDTFDVIRFNYGIITLFPKVFGADKITQYRPISLLQCIYKLITKIDHPP